MDTKSERQKGEDSVEIAKILDQMDVPLNRRTDWMWLGRNLGVRNSSHPQFLRVMTLIRSKACAERSLFVDQVFKEKPLR